MCVYFRIAPHLSMQANGDLAENNQQVATAVFNMLLDAAKV
jgi:hypothetical protein